MTAVNLQRVQTQDLERIHVLVTQVIVEMETHVKV